MRDIIYKDFNWEGIVTARRKCKDFDLTHGVEYYVETRREPNGALKGYRMYYGSRR